MLKRKERPLSSSNADETISAAKRSGRTIQRGYEDERCKQEQQHGCNRKRSRPAVIERKNGDDNARCAQQRAGLVRMVCDRLENELHRLFGRPLPDGAMKQIILRRAANRAPPGLGRNIRQASLLSHSPPKL